MKKNIFLIGIILSTIVLAILSVLIVVRIRSLGTRPVAPSVPESKPKAEEQIPEITPAAECRISFVVREGPTLTPTPTGTIRPSPTPTGTIRPSPTPTVCRVKIQGRIYLDVSKEADYRVSEQETYGPASFRVDLKYPGAGSFTTGEGSKGTNSDNCSSRGGYATLLLDKKTGYSLRLVLNDSTWEVSEAYLANGTSCKSNKIGSLTTIGLGSNVATIQGINFDSCATKNIWFGVRRKVSGTPTPTPTGTIRPSPTPTVTPTVTPTPTGVPTVTNTPGPTITNTPTPTNTPVPTSTPVPGASFCEYLQAAPTSGSASLAVNFSGKGFDSTRIKGFRFNFGDNDKQEFFGSFNMDHIQTASHTYGQPGVYSAFLEILDNGDHWKTRGECRVTITVSGLAEGPTSTPRSTSAPRPTRLPQEVPTEAELPEAGLKMPTLWGLIAGFLLISLGAALVF